MWVKRVVCAAALMSAAIAAGCGSASPAARAVEASTASSTGGTGTLSVTAFRVSGWHDDSYHYLPALSVTAPASGRSVFVQRVDFTADDAGTRRLLKGVRYAASKPIHPGRTVALVPDGEASDPTEIASPLALVSIVATVLFSDDDGQTGIVTAAAAVPVVPDRASLASLVIRRFTVHRRTEQGRFVYFPQLTLVETSGRSRASVRKIVFELLDLGSAGQARPIWKTLEVASGGTINLVNGTNGQAPWFEIASERETSRMSVAISFVDDAGRGGLVSTTALVDR